MGVRVHRATGLALAALGHLRARRAEAATKRQALSDAGASVAGELAVLSVLAEEAVEPAAGGRAAGRGAAQRSASLARLCVSCERVEDLKAGLRRGAALPDPAADHLNGLLADADRALREAGRGDVPLPGLAPWRAQKLAAALRAP